MRKRSLNIAGHRTSVALEDEFWALLEEMADERGLPLSALIGQIDEARSAANLSSALRVAAVRWLGARTASPAGPE